MRTSGDVRSKCNDIRKGKAQLRALYCSIYLSNIYMYIFLIVIFTKKNTADDNCMSYSAEMLRNRETATRCMVHLQQRTTLRNSTSPQIDYILTERCSLHAKDLFHECDWFTFCRWLLRSWKLKNDADSWCIAAKYNIRFLRTHSSL